jgi:hypothetical protein
VTSNRTVFGQSSWTGSSRVDAMTQFVVHALEPAVATQLISPTPRPWRTTVASPDSVLWHGVLERLLTVLRARAQEPTDRDVSALALAEEEHTDSSSVYSLTMRSQWRCPGSSTQWLYSERVMRIVVRHHATYWEAVRDGPTIIGDPAACRSVGLT